MLSFKFLGLYNRFCSCGGICSFESYQKLFDIETKTVLSRFKTVFLFYKPIQKPTFIAHLRAKGFKGPDLYGPFWIATTFVLLTAMFSNLGKYLATSSLKQNGEEMLNDPLVLSYAATIIYSFAFGSPLFSYFFLTFWISEDEDSDSNEGIKNLKTIGLFEFMCLYGYSYLAFFPAIVIAALPYRQTEYLGLFLGTLWSCGFLLSTFKNIANFGHLEVFNAETQDIEVGFEDTEQELLEFESLDGEEEEIELEIDILEKREFSVTILLPFIVMQIILGLTLKIKFFSNS